MSVDILVRVEIRIGGMIAKQHLSALRDLLRQDVGPNYLDRYVDLTANLLEIHLSTALQKDKAPKFYAQNTTGVLEGIEKFCESIGLQFCCDNQRRERHCFNGSEHIYGEIGENGEPQLGLGSIKRAIAKGTLESVVQRLKQLVTPIPSLRLAKTLDLRTGALNER